MFKSHCESHPHRPMSSGERMETMRAACDVTSPQNIWHEQKDWQTEGDLPSSKHLSFSRLCVWLVPSILFLIWSSQRPCELGITIPTLKMRKLRLRKLKYLSKITQLLIGKVRIPTQIHLTLKSFDSWFLKTKSSLSRGLPAHTHHEGPLSPETDSLFCGLWAGPANKDMGITVSSRNKSNFSTCIQVNVICFSPICRLALWVLITITRLFSGWDPFPLQRRLKYNQARKLSSPKAT